MTARVTENDRLAVEITRALLTGVAGSGPSDAAAQVRAERRAFTALSAAYFADPRRALAGADTGGGYVKFGLPGVEQLLTPIFLAAANEILSYLSDQVGTLTRTTLRRMLAPPAQAPALTPEQWAHVRQVVEQALMRHGGMPPQRAGTLASAAVGDGLTWQGEPE